MPTDLKPSSEPAPVIDQREAVDQTGLGEQLAAAVQLDNVAANAVREAWSPTVQGPYDPDFDPFDHLDDEEKLQALEFSDANSEADIQRIRDRLSRRRQWEDTLSSGPLHPFIASLAAGVADPTAYVPLVGAAGRGASFGSRVARGMAAGAVEVGASEAFLQELQKGRTAEESAYSTVAGLILGGALSSAGAALGRTVPSEATMAQAKSDIETMLRVTAPQQGFGTSAGAARVSSPFDPLRDAEGRDMSLQVGHGLVKAYSKVLDKVALASPAMTMATSRFATSRALLGSLTDTGMISQGNLQGLTQGIDLETRIKSDGDQLLIPMAEMLGQQYKTHRKNSKAGGREPMSRALFYDQVGRAMRHGTKSADPEVNAMAQWMRQNIFDPLADRAQATTSKDTPLIHPDITPEQRSSYLTRIYKTEEIIRRRPEFQGIVTRWLKNNFKEEDLADSGTTAENLAEDIASNILGHERGRLPSQISIGKRGPLKSRVFNIPDSLIEDFVDNNILNVASTYIRTMAADINTAQMFGEVDPTDLINKRIQEEADVQMGKLTDADTKGREKIQKEADRAKSDAAALTNLVRGVSATPKDPRYDGLRDFGKNFRTFNFVRLLGGATVTAFPDIARPVLVRGALPLARLIIGQSFDGFKGLRMAVVHAKRMGTAGDLVNASRAKSMFDLGESYSKGSMINDAIDTLGSKFGTVIGMNHWNTFQKGITSMSVSTNIADAAGKLAKKGKLSTAMKAKLARSGLNERDLKGIEAEREHFVDHAGGVTLLNTQEWGDQNLARHVEQAVVKDVDNAIITPGRADAPIWTNEEWGKTVFQFKRFAWASNQRMLIAGLQAGLGARDLNTLSSFATLFTLGAMSLSIKDIARDGQVRDRTSEQWAVDAVSASGLISIAFELDTVLDKATFGTFSAQRAITGDQTTRAAERNAIGQIAGPGFGLVEDTIGAVGNTFRGDFTQSDLHKVRKILPYQNVIYLRGLLDQVEEFIGDQAGLPERAERRSRARADVDTGF